MSIETIPAGQSVVVTERDRHWVALMEAIKDAQANDVEVTKDAQAHLAELIKDAEADGVRTTKDSEANLERSLSASFQNVVQDVKDAEARLETSIGDKFVNTIQDIKDAETRITATAGDRFIQTIQDIKETAFAVKAAECKVVETVKDAEYEGEKSHSRTREQMCEGFDAVNDSVQDTRRELLKTQYQLALEAERSGAERYKTTLLQFKDQALLSERLAASQELLSEKLAAQASREAAECCCEIKQLVTAEAVSTRALINSLEHDRLRDKANKAEAALSAYFAGKVVPSVPVV